MPENDLLSVPLLYLIKGVNLGRWHLSQGLSSFLIFDDIWWWIIAIIAVVMFKLTLHRGMLTIHSCLCIGCKWNTFRYFLMLLLRLCFVYVGLVHTWYWSNVYAMTFVTWKLLCWLTLNSRHMNAKRGINLYNYCVNNWPGAPFANMIWL